MSDLPEPTFAIGIPGLEPEIPRNCRWLPGLHFLTFLFGFMGPLAILNPCCLWDGQRKLMACKSNCKNVATALEMYASDNSGNYPRSLHRLTVGGYLKTIPTCPPASEATYTNYRLSRNPDTFSFACVGNNHAGPYDNYPRYDAEESVTDHP